jgi:hypothetical protein
MGSTPDTGSPRDMGRPPDMGSLLNVRSLPDPSTFSAKGRLVGAQKVDGVKDVTLLAEGGYNSIWLVELCASLEVN